MSNMKSHSEIINQDLYTRNVNQYIGTSYTRLNTLRELVYNTYGNSSIQDATKLNIFIDLFSVVRGLYSEHHRIIIDNITDISAGIINLCAHYRGFFRNQLGVDTRIFLINSTNTCDINRKFVGTYNSEFIRKMEAAQTVRMIDNNMKLLKILCPYLPAVYYIDSPQQFEVSVIIAHLIERLNDNNPNLIISHDMYPLQLCSQYRWTSYLYPRKGRDANGELIDTSWMLPVNDKPNFKEYFWNEYCKLRMGTQKGFESLCRIDPINYPLLISICSFPERKLTHIASQPMAIKFIYDLVSSERVKIDHNMFLNDPELADKYPIAMIDARYKAMDVQYMLPFYRSSPESSAIQLLDLDDPAAVNNIAAKYYANNPLDLQKL